MALRRVASETVNHLHPKSCNGSSLIELRQARYPIDEKWLLHLITLVGGGGSKYQWDVFGGVGYAINANWSAFAGYRAFKVNYWDGDFIYDVLQHRPLIGVQYRW